MSSLSVRSGVAVRPSNTFGLRCPSSSLVRRRAGTVELVDDDDVEGVGREPVEIESRERLDGAEHVPPLAGTSPAT